MESTGETGDREHANLCAECHRNPIGKTRRKYCDVCGPHASVFLKRRNRVELRADSTTTWPYWLEPWVAMTGDPERARAARRAYMRGYMRKWRARRHQAAPETSTAPSASSSVRSSGCRSPLTDQNQDVLELVLHDRLRDDRAKFRESARNAFVAPEMLRTTCRTATEHLTHGPDNK
jgi:hypothetical protein